jgi:hypothetical protein
VRIQLLHVPGCANVEAARQLLHETIDELELDVEVEDEEGDFASPTILVDGADVMGRPTAAGPSCRLDLPTKERLVSSLRR